MKELNEFMAGYSLNVVDRHFLLSKPHVARVDYFFIFLRKIPPQEIPVKSM